MYKETRKVTDYRSEDTSKEFNLALSDCLVISAFGHDELEKTKIRLNQLNVCLNMGKKFFG